MIPQPPAELDYNAGPCFVEIGQAFKQHFIDFGLKPDDRVLDVGCGLGRMAIPLTEYLTSRASYRGFDIVPSGIGWCQQNITPHFPNFQFLHADVFNRHYNPAGKTAARDYKFPFETGRFDFVFLTSVFTHMIPADVSNYLEQIARVMRPGAKCLITWFLMNHESLARMVGPGSTFDFRFTFDGFRAANEKIPEAAIAYDEADIESLFKRCGLKIVGPIHYGNWCGRTHFLSFQDIIVAEK
jgi:SAM-dependent methyltransferase